MALASLPLHLPMSNALNTLASLSLRLFKMIRPQRCHRTSGHYLAEIVQPTQVGGIVTLFRDLFVRGFSTTCAKNTKLKKISKNPKTGQRMHEQQYYFFNCNHCLSSSRRQIVYNFIRHISMFGKPFKHETQHLFNSVTPRTTNLCRH